jgi:hypothetical protein
VRNLCLVWRLSLGATVWYGTASAVAPQLARRVFRRCQRRQYKKPFKLRDILGSGDENASRHRQPLPGKYLSGKKPQTSVPNTSSRKFPPTSTSPPSSTYFVTSNPVLVVPASTPNFGGIYSATSGCAYKNDIYRCGAMDSGVSDRYGACVCGFGRGMKDSDCKVKGAMRNDRQGDLENERLD